MRARATPAARAMRGAEVDAAGVLVGALADVEAFEVEGAGADDEVVGDHDAGDGAEEARVADEPAEDVGGEVGEEPPGHHGDAEQAGDEASGAEGDELWGEVGEVV